MRRSPDQILRLIAFGLGALATLFAAAELAKTVTPQAPLEPSADQLLHDFASRACIAAVSTANGEGDGGGARGGGGAQK